MPYQLTSLPIFPLTNTGTQQLAQHKHPAPQLLLPLCLEAALLHSPTCHFQDQCCGHVVTIRVVSRPSALLKGRQDVTIRGSHKGPVLDVTVFLQVGGREGSVDMPPWLGGGAAVCIRGWEEGVHCLLPGPDTSGQVSEDTGPQVGRPACLLVGPVALTTRLIYPFRQPIGLGHLTVHWLLASRRCC